MLTDPLFLIVGTLQDSLSPEPTIRKQAEQKLLNTLDQVDACQVLLQVALSQDQSVPIRQLAAVTLKQSIESKYKYLPDTTKQWIKSNILVGLDDPCHPIRSSIAYAICKIIQADDAWQGLLEELAAKLNGTPFQVHGSLKVLHEIMNDEMSELQIPTLASLILPQLSRLFTESQNEKIQTKCLDILKDFTETLGICREEYPFVIRDYIAPIMTNWLVLFKSVLMAPISVLHLHVLKTLCSWVENFKEIAPYETFLFEATLHALGSLEAQYLSSIDEDQTEEYDSDGESQSISSLIGLYFDLLELLIEKPHIKPFVTEQVLGQLASYCITFSHITREIETSWQQTKQWVEDEVNPTSFNSLRQNVENLMSILVKLGIYPGVVSQLSRLDTWKRQEAALFVLELSFNGYKNGFDLQGFLSQSFHSNPFVHYRWLMTSATFVQYLSPAFAESLMQKVIETPHVLSCKVVDKLLSSEHSFSHLQQPLTSCLLRIPIENESGASLVLETLSQAVALGPNVDANIVQFLASVCTTQDPLLASLVMELVSECIKIQLPIEQSLVPILFGNLSSTTVDLLTLFFKQTQHPGIYLENISLLTHSILHGSDVAMYQNAQEYLLVASKHSLGSSQLQEMLQCISKLLEPSIEESYCLFVGEWIIALLPHIHHVISDILNAILIRLETAKQSRFIESLVHVFVHLMQEHFTFTLEYFKSRNSHILFHKLVEHFDDFSGSEMIFLTCRMMVQLYYCADPFLNFNVKGDIIVTSSIRTRSMTRSNPDTWTFVPLKLKLIKLLIGELDQLSDVSVRQESDEDSEWEDETVDGAIELKTYLVNTLKGLDRSVLSLSPSENALMDSLE